MKIKLKKRIAVLAIVCIFLTMLPAQLFARNAMDSVAGDRLGGIDRYETAAKVAQQGWTKSDYAILSAGMDENLVDALTAAPLAKKLDAPILLTEGNALNKYTEAELTRLGVKTVYVTSGTGTITQNVLTKLSAMGIQYEVLGGADRFETSVNIAKKLGAADKIVVATAYTNADALSISSIAAAKGMPILLSPVTALPSSVANYLTSVKDQITQSYVVGAAGALSNAVQAALPNASRAGGVDRFATNVEVLKAFDADLKYDNLYVANGTDAHLVDALVVSPLAARSCSPIILVDNTLPAGTRDYLASKVNHETTGVALGGVTVVTPGILGQISGLVKALPTWGVSVTAAKSSLKADGKDNTVVKFEVKDYQGNYLDVPNGIVEFNTTFGNLGQKRVALQNGVAEVILTSEFLTSGAVASVSGKIVESTDQQYIGLDATTTVSMGMDFVPVNKPILSAAESDRADRVVVYFNQPVSVGYFIDEEGLFKAGIKFDVTQERMTNNSIKQIPVQGVMPVPGNASALSLILAKPLNDNDNVNVKFADKTGDVTVISKAPQFILTDARNPEVSGVKALDMRTIQVSFTEPVDVNCFTATAKNFNNWIIDGVKLDPDRYSIRVGGFTPTAEGGIDERNVVTIQKKILPIALEDPFWMDAWYTAGKHSVQSSLVGDWAYPTDANNVSTTQLLNFDVTEDSTIPVATITEQSPEQWLMSFNVPVYGCVNDALGKFELQVLNKSTNHWEKVGAAEFTTDAHSGAQLPVLVTKMSNNKFLFELEKDWTKYYNSIEQNNSDYYTDQYRVVLADHGFRNPANGKVSDAQQLGLEDNIMKSLDSVPAALVGEIQQITDEDFRATFNEPIKVRDPLCFAQNYEGATASRYQEAMGGLPVATAQFTNGTKTVDATISLVEDLNANHDMQIDFSAKQQLSDGTWTLVINGITDDVGNTSPTITKQFTVKKPQEFRVFAAVANIDKVWWDSWNSKIEWGYDSDPNYDYVVVGFTKDVAVTGDVNNVLKTSNYTLNGVELPLGTEIYLGNICNNSDEKNVITIRLPQAANALYKPITGMEQASPNVLKLVGSLTASDGQQISGDLELRLPYIKY